MPPKFISVMSGKGGVGKSTISITVATILSERYRTLILDFDICGPTITHALNVKGKIVKSKDGFGPLNAANNLDVLSFGSILKESDAVIWRGAKKKVFLELMFNSALGYDYVVIDTPPGISEEHSFLADRLPSVLIVTTPQNIALNDTQNCIEFCQQKSMSILGLIENMSGLECECCEKILYPFGKNGGVLLAEEYEIPFITSLKIEPLLGEILDNGEFIQRYMDLESYTVLKDKISKLLNLSHL